MGTKAPAKNKPAIGFPFIAVPVELLNRDDLTARDVLVFSMVVDNARYRGGKSRLSNGHFAKRLSLRPESVSRILRKLIKSGLLNGEYLAGGRVRVALIPAWQPKDTGLPFDSGTDLPALWEESPHLPDSERYALYLCSREWGVRREAVRARCGDTCERCQNAAISHVHHLTYVRKYAEPLEDLLGVCEPCHEFIHGKSNHDPKIVSQIVAKRSPDPFAAFSVVA